MVRANRRKGIEEVYGTKLEAMQPARMQVVPQPGMTKTATLRVNSSRQGDGRTQRSYVTANDYYITTNVPLNATNMRAAPSSTMAHSAKSGPLAVQVQSTSASVPSYGSMSNRRGKPSARQQQQPSQQAKVHFVSAETKSSSQQARQHAHSHPYSKSMPLQMTQRTVYGLPSAMETNLSGLMDKDQVHNSSSRRSHTHPHQNMVGSTQLQHGHSHHSHTTHPLQHQLHQQQHLPSNNSIHSSMQQMLQHPHSSLKHQQQQHHQQIQQQHLMQQQLQHQHQHQHQQQQQQQLPHQRVPAHQHQRGMQMPLVTEEEDEKEEDPEEFFELIRQTVRKAVGSTVSDVISRNFRDLANKMERFSNELKITNDNLGKLQTEVTKKVAQYGEENIRNFRYLCMKSEYDKLFYQQHTMAANKEMPAKVIEAPQMPIPMSKPMLTTSRVSKQTAAFNMKSGKQLTGRKLAYALKKAPTDSAKKQNPCACHSSSKSSHPQEVPSEDHRSSSEQSFNAKSSEMGVREVLGHLQRYCTQMQLGDMREDPPKYNSQTGLLGMDLDGKLRSPSGNLGPDQLSANSKTMTHATNVTAPAEGLDLGMETPVDSMDEIEVDRSQFSSDEMSSYSEEESDVKFSGSTTARAPLQSSRAKLQASHSNNGAGDGQ